MHARCRFALACACLAVAASSVQAQTPSGPGSELAARQRARLALSLSLRETLSDDLFITSRQGSPNPTTSATMGLGFGISRGPLTLGGSGWANGTLLGRSGRNQGVQSGLALGADFALTRGVHLRLNTSYSNGLNLDALYGSQEAFPQLDVKSLLNDLGFSYQLGPSTTVSATLSGMFVRYRASEFFDLAALPSDTLVPPSILPPAGGETPEEPAPVTPEPVPLGVDNTMAVLGVLTGAGLETPKLDYWTWRGSADVAHQFSAKTRGRLTLGYRGAFGSPAAYTQGDQIDGQVEWSRAIGSRSTLALSYAEQQDRYSTRFATHTLGVRGDRTLSRRVTVDASLGGSYLEAPERGNSSWEGVGGAGVSVRLGRSALSMRYDRNRYQSLLGSRSYTTDAGIASFSHRLTRSLSIAAFGTYRSTEDALGQGAGYRSYFVGTTCGMRIGRKINAGAVYSYQRFDRGGRGSLDRYVASVFAGYALARR